MNPGTYKVKYKGVWKTADYDGSTFWIDGLVFSFDIEEFEEIGERIESFKEKVEHDIKATREANEVSKKSWENFQVFLHGIMIEGVKPFMFKDKKE